MLLPRAEVFPDDSNKVVSVGPNLLVEKTHGVHEQMHNASRIEALNLK